MRAKTGIAVAALGLAAAGVLAAAAALGAFSGASTSAASGDQAITAHGAWTIEVRDHGRLVRQVHFHNSLTSNGNDALIRFLSVTNTVGTWSVTGSCGSGCGYAYPVTATYDPVAENLVLQGSATVGSTGSITDVTTYVHVCSGVNCNAYDFTHATLGTPIPIVNGQQVLTVVKIWFS